MTDAPYRIVTDRLVIRCYDPRDAPLLKEATDASLDHLRPWMPWAHDEPQTLEQMVALIRRFRGRFDLGEDFVYGIFERDESRLLGGTGLHRINWDLRTFEIGYWLRRSAEGQGYVREAVQLLTRLAFEKPAANRVEIMMDTRNVRSRNVPERLGYVLEGTLRNKMPDVVGRPRDVHIFALTPEDYRHLSWRAGGR